MGYKGTRTWKKDGESVEKDHIDDNGVWQSCGDIRSDLNTTIWFSSATADDASGATVVVGIRTEPTLAPVPVENGSLTLANLSTSENVLPAMFEPKGDICVTVSGYQAKIRARVAQ